MKNLLYKEFRLAIHPSVYIFFALAALLLVPSYPYYVSFFYLTLGIFLTFKTNRAENDIFYSALLPVRKGDVVRARVLTVALLELANILIAIPFAVISAKINPAGGNNAGIEPNAAFFGLSFLMYGGFNLIFFPVFYKTGRSEGKAFLWGGVFTFLYIIAAESLDEVRHALAQGGMAKNVKILSEKGRELTVLALDRAALLWNLRARFDVRREEDDFWVVRKARAARQADSPNN